MVNIMDNLNFVKNIDNLGRIVIPMDIRKKFNINTGDILSISCNDNHIILNKHNSLDCNSIKTIINLFIDIFNLKIILMDFNNVLYSNIVNNCKLSTDTSSMIRMGNSMKYLQNSLVFDSKKVDGTYNMLPIVSNVGIVGSLIVFGDESSKAYDFCSIIVKLIELGLNIS